MNAVVKLVRPQPSFWKAADYEAVESLANQAIAEHEARGYRLESAKPCGPYHAWLLLTFVKD